MKKIIKTIFSFIFCLLVSCGISENPTISIDDSLTVQLEESEYYDVLSENPVKVKKGGDVAFKIDIIDGRLFDYSDDGVFDESKSVFLVENVQYSKTVSLKTRPVGDCTLTIINDDSKSEYIVTPNRMSFAKGENVTIETISKNSEFMCYTFDEYYRVDNLSKGSKMPASFEEKFTFTIEGDVTLYMNYFIDGYAKMNYDANGGKTIDGKELFIIDYHRADECVNPVTILGTYYLFRDGYTLESYNTKADGTGVRVGIGSKVDYEHFENNEITLYAQWKKWTDESNFEVEDLDENSVTIKKYNGDSSLKEIVIPNTINGKLVKKISEKAFENIDVEKLVLNLDLENVESKAVDSCNKLIELVMFTNVTSIKNDSMASTSLKKIFINSTVYTNNKADHDRDFTYQLDYIDSLKNNRVIFVGQSTIRCNHDFSPFKEKYPNKDFYAFGAQAGANFAIPLDILCNYLKESDTIVISLLETTMRKSYVGSGTFTFVKNNFDLLTLINYQDYKNVLFSSYEKFIAIMTKGIDELIYNPERKTNVDNYGCYGWGPAVENEDNVDPTYTPTFEKYQKVEEIKYFDTLMEKSKVLKENRFITWSSYNENSVTDYEMFDGFENFIKTNLSSFNYFDTIRENIYPGSYFRKNDSIHLSSTGSVYRISRWLEQIPLN